MRVPSSLSQNRVAMGSLWSTGLSSNFAFISIKFHSYPFISISHPINSTSPAPPSGRFALQRFKAAEMLSSFLAKRNEHAAVSKDMDMCCINMCIYIYVLYICKYVSKYWIPSDVHICIFANLSESGRSLRFSLMVWHVVMHDTYCDADALEDVWHAVVATYFHPWAVVLDTSGSTFEKKVAAQAPWDVVQLFGQNLFR